MIEICSKSKTKNIVIYQVLILIISYENNNIILVYKYAVCLKMSEAKPTVKQCTQFIIC